MTISPQPASSVDAIASRAADVARPFAEVPLSQRARMLTAFADALESEVEELVALAADETGLSSGRLRGELSRTAVQLRMFADVVIGGAFTAQRLDVADDKFVLGPRPELRRVLVPVGPVAVFAASNFPFAFSVLGGDTASALAAGCPVVVKTHPGHPRLSLAVAEIATRVLASGGIPEAVLSVVAGEKEGIELLQHPALRAASFTGSIRAGLLLAGVAASRPRPIPFFGELGSLNPVFVTPAASDREDIAAGYAASISGSAGQLCTKPGILFALRGSRLAERTARILETIGEHRMLYPGLGQGYADRRQRVLASPGVRVLHEGSVRVDDDEQVWVTPTLVSVSPESLDAAREDLLDEAFGPLSIVVEYETGNDLPGLLTRFFEGSLTATLWMAEGDEAVERAWLPELRYEMSQIGGRMIQNGWPTGVAVSPAQQHGGPWPSTTDSSSTSVGTASIVRFLRPVTFQSVPEHSLPVFVRAELASSAEVQVAAAGESRQWGSGVSN